MKVPGLLGLSVVALSLTFTGCAKSSGATMQRSSGTPKKTMRPFRSMGEVNSYLKKYLKRSPQMFQFNIDSQGGPTGLFTVYDGTSITNVQHAGVDEGGIVKLHGNYLVVLRRGRLFTINVAKDELKPVSMVDAFAPDIDPQHTWYDELLISGNTVIVIGYSYQRGGTEIGLFNIDNGKLEHRSTYHLRSNDYFSSRNYASRVVRGKLIFYAPLYLFAGEDPAENFPALRKWRKGVTDKDFNRIISPDRIYRPEYQFLNEYGVTLHTVTVCDPTGGELRCEATSVIGPEGHVFYVSPESVYVWTTDTRGWGKRSSVQSLLYRLPLDGSAPSALKVSGGPVNQFSFLESSDSYLNVLVRTNAGNESMFSSEAATGPASLLRVPLASFSDGGEHVSAAHYRTLPTPAGSVFQNRYVGDYLLYGTSGSPNEPDHKIEKAIFAVRWSGGDPIRLPLSHPVERIEQMGPAAVIIGGANAQLHFSAVSLGNLPKLENDYIRMGAAQGETRSHGFFYRPDSADSGVLGLPIAEPGGTRYEHLRQTSASVLYLRNASLRFHELGNLAAKANGSTDDACRASCVDWYGNSRPLFLHGRVFALLGYELVEGVITGEGIRELRRTNYAPQLAAASRN